MLTRYTPHIDIIQRTNLQPSTKRQYIKAIERLIEAHVDPRNRDQLTRYASELPTSSRSFLKSALTLLYKDMVTTLKASANRDNLADVQAALLNIEAMTETIQVRKEKGAKAHLWLSPEQVERITSIPDRSIVQGRRDWVVLGLLFGAGLRREELANLTFEDIKIQPMKNGQPRAVLEVLGKGDKKRVIPISDHLRDRLNAWHTETGDGYVARAINKSGVINGSLSAQAVMNVVRFYGELIGLPQLAPHDCRRSWAQIGLNSGVSLVQISKLLGHASIKTTQDYLDMDLDIEQTISDFVPLA